MVVTKAHHGDGYARVVNESPRKSAMVTTFSTELEHPCPFHFGHDIACRILDELARHQFDRIFFISEADFVASLGRSLFESVCSAYNCSFVAVPIGEKSKRFSVLEDLCEELIAAGVTKRSILIAFGGGSIGNIVGLTAGLIYRGIRYIEIPTTFTGQTDSTLSNKQAVNGKKGKNHFGLYHTPLFVWSDTRYLETEPLRSRRAGLVEGVKNGFIHDASFLDYLENVLDPCMELTNEELTEIAYRVIQSKIQIIRRDPSEKHECIILEYGHTFGHAIEWIEKGRLLHGEAVAIGMKIAADLAFRLGLISESECARHRHILESHVGAVDKLPQSISPEMLVGTMRFDNKVTGRTLRYILLEREGKCYNPEGDFLVPVPDEIVLGVLRDFVRKEHDGINI